MSTTFETTLLEFHTDKMPFKYNEISENTFGILTIKPNKCKPITIPIVIQCTIDISDSMNEPSDYNNNSKHSRNKVDFIKQTLTKMLPYLLENFNMEIWIQIGLFNTIYSTLIPLEILTSENLEYLLEKIDSIRCCGCTNIEEALKGSSEIIKTNIGKHPDHKHLHIFLTDGNPTDGSNSECELSKLVSSEYPTLFIGYGDDHNSQLLKACSNKLLHSYQYVDNFEITGLVYAEMLYSLIYTAVEKPTIVVEAGQIYDALNDIWTNKLELPAFVSEKEYIYHILSSNTDDVIIQIYDKENDLLEIVPSLPRLISEDGSFETTKLDKYIFKQKTMELLSGILKINDSDDIDRKKTIKIKKEEISDFYKVIRAYMRENELLEDPFMKVLCEDLHISYQTANTHYAEMNILSRRNAQATQGLYRSGSSNRRHTEPVYTPNIGRLNSRNTYDFEDEYNDDEDTQIEEYLNPVINIEDANDSIETYQDDFVTQNIYSPNGMVKMGRNISD